MNTKILLIYKSKSGFTKRYAEMVAKEIPCTLLKFEQLTADILTDYDIIVFGSRAYAGRIDGYRKMKEMRQNMKLKHFMIFVTGATPNTAQSIINNLWEQNLSAEERDSIPHFYCQSGLCYEKLSFLDRLIMRVISKMMKHKKNKNEYEQGFAQAISSSYDSMSKTYIQPLISMLKEMNVS